MIAPLLGFLTSGLVLVIAGVFLTRAAEGIAERSGLGRLWMGSILLAAATSLPELAADVSAVRQGAADLAAGDLFGSSMANMLILAALGLSPPRDEVFRRSSLDHALSAGLAIATNALAALLLVTRPTTLIAGVSPGSILLLALFLVGSHVVYRQTSSLVRSRMPGPGPGDRPRGGSLRKPVLHFAAAAAVILLAAPFFSSSAQGLAELSVLGSSFFGTLFVGLATSLPEIVTCAAALRMGAFDLAVGSLFGSNVFNMTIFLAMDLALPEASIFAVLAPTHVVSALVAIILMALGLASIVFRAERRFALLEPGSLVMVLTYAAGVVVLYRAYST
jgi:cation:H+ antiporter